MNSLLQPLRILQVVPAISPVYGGPSQMISGLAKGLASQGVEVTILTTTANGDNGQAPLEVPLQTPVFQNGYHIRYFRCSPFRRYKFSWELLDWLAHHTHQFDLAHIHALFSPVSSGAAAIARWRHLPYILRPLGTLDPADLQKKRHLKQLYAGLIERSNLAGAAAIHFTSPQEAQISQRFGVVTNDCIMPLGVDHQPAPLKPLVRQRFNIPEDRPIVLFMSRIDPKKGLDRLLPALEQLLAQGVKFHFVLAGANPQDPSYEHQIYAQIQTSPLQHCTTMTGFVAGELKSALLHEANLFVLPSYYENFGIAVAEAMVAGLPVVISDQVHIWPDIERSHSGWVTPCDIATLATTLRQALEDPSEQQQRGTNAQTYALQHYSWQAIAGQMIEIYQDIVQRSPL
jgi:glycosyltransferase involved in cell wall biosynthesis